MPQPPRYLTKDSGTLCQRFLALEEHDQKVADRFFELCQLGAVVTPGAHTFVAATAPVNVQRNRYLNVLPYDHTRAVLPVKSGSASDYINALHVVAAREPQGAKHYIAAQGPLSNTAGHFWYMVYHATPSPSPVVVVMVTPLKEGGRAKCFKYWPEPLEPAQEYHDPLFRFPLLVACVLLVWMAQGNYTRLKFVLTNMDTGESKTAHHLHYDEWADFSMPKSSGPLLLLAKNAWDLNGNQPLHPLVVHCLAGVGRTGTFIALDHLNSGGLAEKDEDPVVAVVQRLRNQRVKMVQSMDQFGFLHTAAREIWERQ